MIAGGVMVGTRVRAMVAAVIALLTIASGVPAAAQPRMSTTFVPGVGTRMSVRSTPDGIERQVTVPGLAALRRATTRQQVRDAWTAHVAALAEPAAAGLQVADAYPVADLNGDGRRDVIVLRESPAGVQYSAIAGASGKGLWNVDSALTGMLEGSAVRALRGDAGGVLLMASSSEQVESEAAWILRITTEIVAVSPDGTTRWSKTYRGSVTFSEFGATYNGLAYPAGIGPINGAGDDVAVRIEDSGYTATSGGVTRMEVLDGATGAMTLSLQSAGQGEAPGTGLVGDLNGDKLRDIVFASSAGDQVQTVAHSGATGTPVWRNSFTSVPVVYIESVGHGDADKANDLMYTGFSWETEQFFATTVASGSDGQMRWQRFTDGAAALKDINGDKKADVLLFSAVFESQRIGLRYEAVTATGKRIYNRFQGVKPTMSGSGMAGIGLWDAGDVDADGNVDLAQEVVSYTFSSEGAEELTDEGVVLARSGRRAFSGRVGNALYASIDGRGQDLVRVIRTADGVRLVASDGRTNKELWRRSLKLSGFQFGFAVGADLTGDRVAEVLLVAYRRGGDSLTVLDGRTQRLRWGR